MNPASQPGTYCSIDMKLHAFVPKVTQVPFWYHCQWTGLIRDFTSPNGGSVTMEAPCDETICNASTMRP